MTKDNLDHLRAFHNRGHATPALAERQVLALERIADTLDDLTALMAAGPALAATGADPRPDAEDWIEWHGGRRPVAPGTLVDYRLKNGGEYSDIAAWQLDWRHGETVPYYDIIAYRIHKEPK